MKERMIITVQNV